MHPIHDLQEIEKYEKKIEEQHIIILLLVQPSDKRASDFISKFNYWNYLADKYCSIYILGYSKGFDGKYSDVVKVDGVDNAEYEYSDCCFIETCDQLRKRLKNWRYSGEAELIVLQKNNNPKRKSALDFSCYHYIDVNYGLDNNYIDSVPRFMQRLIDASKSVVTADKGIAKAQRNKLSTRKVLETAIEKCPKLPKPIKKILRDGVFFKSYK